MTHETYIKNYIASKNPQSYLEIGIGTGKLYNSIEIEDKDYCDPAVNGIDSDTFFKHCKIKYDLIFIDGLHHADQVERDILNAWKCLNKDGVILVHDICPKNEAMTCVPRGDQKEWTGDVYKAWLSLLNAYGEKLHIMSIHEVEYGLGKIYKSRHKMETFLDTEITYSDYENSNLHN